jgi:hypothetical protein
MYLTPSFLHPSFHCTCAVHDMVVVVYDNGIVPDLIGDDAWKITDKESVLVQERIISPVIIPLPYELFACIVR